LPWLSYRSGWLDLDPSQIKISNSVGPLWVSGALGVDYDALDTSWNHALFTSVSATAFVGPVRITNGIKNRFSNWPSTWQSYHGMGAEISLGNGL